MGFLDFFVVGIGAVIFGTYLKQQYQAVAYVESEVDGRRYLVRQTEDASEAADILARLNQNMLMLIDHLRSRYPDDERTIKLHDRYNPETLSEGGHNTGYTSYSVNKGKNIVMCLRNREKDGTHGALESINTLTYVLLHELAHLSTDEVGHTPVFWKNFDFLKDEASVLGIYSDTDYAESPAGYCGMVIKASGKN